MIPGMPHVRDYNHPDFWEDGWILDNPLTGEKRPINKIRLRIAPVTGCVTLPSTADIPYSEQVREFVDKAWQEGPYNARTGQRITAINEGNSSMFDKESIETAKYTIGQEKTSREADEIVRRVADWGSDDYADETVFRFRKTFTARGESGTYTYTALRYTDHCGNVKWALTTGSVQGGGKSWDDFVFWMVTDGAPVAHGDIEVWPPVVFAETRNLFLADQIS